MNRFDRIVLALAALVPLFAAAPAAADDGRRHVMTPLQKIDLVRDLPDEAAFERDGQYFDLGYIYPIHTVNGASVAGGSGESGYVLYHDDRYARVDGGVMRELEFALGEDPTQGYSPPVAASGARAPSAADPWGANGTPGTAKGEPITSRPAHLSSAGRRSGFTIGTFFLLFLVLFIRVRAFRDLVVGGLLAAIAAVVRRSDGEVMAGPAVPNGAMASQAAAQRARLEALSGAPARSSMPSSGGFGRKQA